jgi:3',5'-cyclic AMP phosphodiesterase CpdA
MPIVAQISDLHLSRSRPFFQFNFEAVLDELARVRPDHIVVTGDLALNGAAVADDLAFARAQLDRLPAPWSAVPGNHDVGLVPLAPDQHQPADDARRAQWLTLFGADRFAIDVGDWLLLGLNTQLLGGGLPAEAEQHDWLRGMLAHADRPAALFLHYPLFRHTPDDPDHGHTCVIPSARAALLDVIEGSAVKLVASGHLHREKRSDHRGIAFQWAPATAFIEGEDRKGHGGHAYNGFLLHRFADGAVTSEGIEPRWIIHHDIRSWARMTPHGYYRAVEAAFPGVPA